MPTTLKVKFVAHRSSDRQWYFTIVNVRNGKTLATSELYRKRDSMNRGIRSIAKGLNPGLTWNQYRPWSGT